MSQILKIFRFSSRWDEMYATYGTTKLSCRKTTEMWFDVMNSTKDLGMMMSVLSLIAIILYFVTSSDSGSLVIDCLSANGNPEPPIAQRIFWALTEGATATALLKAGGAQSLNALQSVSIACGLPFTFCLNWTCVALWRAVREEYGEIDEKDGRWYRSLWSIQDVRKIMFACIDIVAPWLRLSQLRMSINKEYSQMAKVFYIIQFAFPFYVWILLMLLELGVEQISYVGWACLMAFFAFAGGIRGEIREIYDIEGNMIEDFFTMMLVYPLAISQMVDQLEEGKTLQQIRENGIEMGGVNSHANGARPAPVGHYPEVVDNKMVVTVKKE